MFTSTVVYDNFTLGQAKAIDVIWHIVVGRAAQAFISFLFYSVLMDVSMRMMEMTPLPLDLFTALVFRPFHFMSKVKVVNSLDRIRGWRITTAMIWFFLSVLYIALISAINDAMTGYVFKYNTHIYFESNGACIDIDKVFFNGVRNPGFDLETLVETYLQEGGALKCSLWISY